MANIKAFKALKPDRNTPASLLDLKASLEPKSSYTGDLQPYLSQFNQLLEKGYFTKEDKPAIYIYENSSRDGIQQGIWAVTNVHDKTIDKIIQHEQTIPEHENKIKAYRELIGLEGKPILLTYLPLAELTTLIQQITSSLQPEYYYEDGVLHQFWKVTDESLILELERAFTRIKNIYVADGHHRLAAAINLKNTEQSWMSTLYIATDQLRIREFNRLIIPDQNINKEDFLELIGRYFKVSPVSDNSPYRPHERHQMGMCLQGIWYQLDLKAEEHHLHQEIDAVILQEYIFKPFFKITDPRQDPQLKNYDPNRGWQALIKESAENISSIAFTLYPMTVEELITGADQEKPLPPKSTWIEPKIPYGLLMYCATNILDVSA